MIEKEILKVLGESNPRKLEVMGNVDIRSWNGKLYINKDGNPWTPTEKELEELFPYIVDLLYSRGKISEKEEEESILFVFNIFSENPNGTLEGAKWNKKFISLIGNDQTDPRVVFIGDKSTVSEESALSRVYTYGVYTYRGDTYFLYLGLDSEIYELSDYELSKIYEKIDKGDFIVSPTYQG